MESPEKMTESTKELPRDFDFLVLGASGFTGKFVVKELTERVLSGQFGKNFKWALAGRSEHALDSVVSSIAHNSTLRPLPEIVIADVLGDEKKLKEALSRTTVVLSCVGPYRRLGEPVVKACVETGTHYLDLCGEPEFIESMTLKYHDVAARNRVKIVHAAAFDSVPADIGVVHSIRVLQEAVPGCVPHGVEMFLRLTSNTGKIGINFATYEAAIAGFSSTSSLASLRRQLNMQRPLPKFVGPKLEVIQGPYGLPKYDKRVGGWVIRHVFSDSAVVRSSRRLDRFLDTKTPPSQFAAYVVIPSLFYLLVTAFYFTIFSTLVKFSLGRKLLLRYPSLFTNGVASRAGPSKETIKGTSTVMAFFATAYSQRLVRLHGGNFERMAKEKVEPDLKTIIRFVSPDPGYVATPILFLHCAKTLLDNISNPLVPSGVLTPAVAFGKTDLVERLNHDGRVQFTVAAFPSLTRPAR